MLEKIRSVLMEENRPGMFFADPGEEERAQLRELYALIGVPQSEKYHPEGDAFTHTMLVVNEAAAVRSRAEKPFAFMLAALTHDLGKAVTTGRKENGDWHSIGHEIKGLPLICAMLSRLGANKETIFYCENLCRLHMRVHTCFYGKAGVPATNRLFSECLCPEDLALLCICDARGTGKPEGSSLPEEAFITERLERFRTKEK